MSAAISFEQAKPPVASVATEPIELASRDEIVHVQRQRISWSLNHAYAHVPHYRQAFDAHGVHPGDFKDLTDLARFPFLLKEDLHQAYPLKMLAVGRDRLARIHASSGTTGQPTVVGYTAHDIDVWADLVARSIRAAGGRAGDMVHVAYGYGMFTGGLGAHYGAERAGCCVIPMSGGQTEKQVRLIHDLRPDLIMVTPSYMQVLIEEFTRQGLDPRLSSLRVGIFGAEPWSEAMRMQIEDAVDMDAVDIYGLSEMMGPGVACECVESKDGAAIWEDHFYPEIIDPDTGEVLPDGAWGELVLTALTKQAQPMIRYRTRDLTRLLPPTSRSFRRLDRIVGRSDDMLIIRGVNVFPSQIEEIVLRQRQLSGQYQIVVQRVDLLDEICVRCELSPGVPPLASGLVDELRQRIQQQVKDTVGVSVDVELVVARGMHRMDGGKAKRVQDLRRFEEVKSWTARQ